MMPGLSGYDVCRRLRADAATALLPVVLVTSLDAQQERVKGIEAGADDFLDKPINQPELFARVRSLLRVKALQDEVRQAGGGAARSGTRSSRSASTRRWPSSADVGAEALFRAAVVRRDPVGGRQRRSSRRIGARSATCSSTCAASPRSPTRRSRKRCRRCCANTTRRWAR